MNKIDIDALKKEVESIPSQCLKVGGVYQEVISTKRIREVLDTKFPGIIKCDLNYTPSIRRVAIDGKSKKGWVIKSQFLEDIVNEAVLFNSKIDSSEDCLVQKELDLNADSYEKMKIELLKRIADGIDALNSKWGN